MHRGSGEDDEDAEGNEGEEIEEAEELVEDEEEVDPRTLLTKAQIQYFKDIFDSFDPNKKERISVKTIGFTLRMMGLNPTKAEIKRHIMDVDPDNKGVVDFQSFLLPMAQRINQEPETHEDVIEAFKVFDEEEKEFVYTDQLVEYMTSLGEDLEDFEIEALLKAADPKATGKVQYVEFVEKMMGIVRKVAKNKKGGKGEKKGGKKGKKK